jgi:predicted acyltransferase
MIQNAGEKNKRLMSLDALRGFDMFWIAGGEGILHALAKLIGFSFFVWVDIQVEHAEWNGFTFHDLIFPLFLFIAGVSMPFSFEKRLSRGDSRGSLYLHIVKRGILLVILGMVYNSFGSDPDEINRYASVLGRIGLAWMFAGIIVMNTNKMSRIFWCAGILLFYWAIMSLIPTPGHKAGDFSMEGNLASFIDRKILPGSLYEKIHDPEGILSTIPAISTALLGVITGDFLKSGYKLKGIIKALLLAVSGIILLIAGRIWGIAFPVNKNLWTSSFVLYAGGWSVIMLAIFYLLIDVLKFKKWAFFFIVIGMNSIAIYLGQTIVDIGKLVDYFFKGLINIFSVNARPVFFWVFYIMISWLILLYLYRKKMFLKI